MISSVAGTVDVVGNGKPKFCGVGVGTVAYTCCNGLLYVQLYPTSV